MDNEKQQAISKKQQEIINLRCHLTSDVSEIGDYKIVKTYEARLQNEADPYDTTDLLKKRQEVRDKINQLESEVAEMQKAEAWPEGFTV